MRIRAGVEARSRNSVAGEAVLDAPGELLLVREIDLLRRIGIALERLSICSYTLLCRKTAASPHRGKLLTSH